jgi:hypothetical protein
VQLPTYPDLVPKLRIKKLVYLFPVCLHGVKGKEVPLQASSGPEGSRKLRFPELMTTGEDDGKVVSLTHRPP